MAVSPSDKELLKYFNQLDEPQKRSLLAILQTFLRKKSKQQVRISLEEYNKELELAIAEILSGDVFSHDEVVKMAKDW